MYWVRVDNRLVHGQIIETWLPFTKSRMIVVANDELSHDELRQEIMGLAIPAHVEKAFVSVAEAAMFLHNNFSSQENPTSWCSSPHAGTRAAPTRLGSPFPS